jgi:hypothetical protein
MIKEAREVFEAFLKLGLTSFGGPVAHIGYYRHEFVERRKWFDERTYAASLHSASSCRARCVFSKLHPRIGIGREPVGAGGLSAT